jgi:hypothetical protein
MPDQLRSGERRLGATGRASTRIASVIEAPVEDIDRMTREVKDMKAITPVTKRRIGFVLDEK